MSINYVQIVPAEEQHSPPSQIIELSVVEDSTDEIVHQETDDGKKFYTLNRARKLVLLSLSEYDETSEGSTSKLKVSFPAMDLNDLIRALGVFGIAGASWHVGDVPFRLPALPDEQQEQPLSDKEGT